jgi:hypothetical protein
MGKTRLGCYMILIGWAPRRNNGEWAERVFRIGQAFDSRFHSIARWKSRDVWMSGCLPCLLVWLSVSLPGRRPLMPLTSDPAPSLCPSDSYLSVSQCLTILAALIPLIRCDQITVREVLGLAMGTREQIIDMRNPQWLSPAPPPTCFQVLMITRHEADALDENPFGVEALTAGFLGVTSDHHCHCHPPIGVESCRCASSTR